MVKIKPFKSIRPSSEAAAEVASLPYDVLSTEEARAIGDLNPKSFLHIDKSEIDLAKDSSPYAETVYLKAAENLQAFIKNEWLIQDKTDNFYIYQLTMNGRVQTGLVVCTSVDDYVSGSIKKHEFTREEKERDRIRHVSVTDANTSPIFLTYRANKSIDQIIQSWASLNAPVYDFSGFHDVRHKVWVIDQLSVLTDLIRLFEQEVDRLYIADGHHRTESAVKVALKRKEQFPEALDTAEFNFFLSVLFPKEQLMILDYNRVVNAPIAAGFFEGLSQKFDVSELGNTPFKPAEPKVMGMYLDQKWYKLTTKEDAIPDHPVEGLDVSILQDQILTPLFDIKDIRTDKRIDFIGGIRGLDELTEAVDSGEFTVAFALFPTSMEDLLAVADSGEVMPPKSTWFEPKLLSGLFIHDLESPSSKTVNS